MGLSKKQKHEIRNFLGIKNPFTYIEVKSSHAVDDIYGPRWATKSVNGINSNGGLCSNCLWRRAEVEHHMMYIPTWKIWFFVYVLKVVDAPTLYRRLAPKHARLYNRELLWLHHVPVCKHCHRPLAKGSVHSKDGWIGHPGYKLLNRNAPYMRWKLRSGWLVTWALSLPIRLLFYAINKALQ